jgi:hypothetical protein
MHTYHVKQIPITWIVLLHISFSTLSVIVVYNSIPTAAANVLTYTNIQQGFTINYPLNK